MKSKFLVVLAVIVFSVNVLSDNSKSEFIFKKGIVGKLKVGDDIDVVAKLYGQALIKKIELFKEGDSYPAIEVFLSEKDKAKKSPAFVVEDSDGKIFRIEVKSEKFRTAKDVGVGSPLGKLKKLYKVELLEGAEMGPTYAVVDELEMSFALDTSAPTPKKTPNTAKVISVLVR